jgi:hypothetical protein
VGFYRGKKARGETSFTEYLAKHGYGLELTFFCVVFFEEILKQYLKNWKNG